MTVDEETLDRVVEFHGHLCPGLTMGIQAARIAERFRTLHQARARQLLEEPPDELFTVEAIDDPPPSRTRIHASVPCAQCGEATMETRIRRLGGRDLCPPCFGAALDGG